MRGCHGDAPAGPHQGNKQGSAVKDHRATPGCAQHSVTMAAKKGGAVALQQDVASDEEWEALLRRPGLLLVDVYSEWCGPCVGMLANLKKIKVELGGDMLVLATAKSDSIGALQRHRNHSEPIWMLISGGKLIDLIFGADAPRIARLIAIELDNEVKIQRGEACTRKYMAWDELTPEEEARLKRAEEKRLRALKEEEERLAKALIQMRADNYAKLATKLHRYTVVLFLPHAVPLTLAPSAPTPSSATASQDAAAGEAEGPVLAALREAWTTHGLQEQRRAHTNITADMANEIFFERKLPQHEELLVALAAGTSLCILLFKPPVEVEAVTETAVGAEAADGGRVEATATPAAPDGQTEDAPPPEQAASAEPVVERIAERVIVEPELGEIEAVVAQSLYGFYPSPNPQPPQQQTQQPQQKQQQPQKAQKQQKQQKEDAEAPDADPEPEWWCGEIQPAVDSPAAACVRAGGGPSGGPALPGLWTPLTPSTKAAAMQTLFPEETLLLSRPPPPPSLLPPSVVHVFNAARCKDVMMAASLFEGAVTGSGFFSEKREPLAADEVAFETLNREKKDSDVFVVAVSSEASGALEAMSSLQPLSASATAEEGVADCDAYFPGPAPPEEDAEEVNPPNFTSSRPNR